ncbi:class I SAM-dependent methyltransferase [Oceanobacillus senegalensis]|uniref:class I SAM-dependent methyltransferase n=1 Tax=Oceanobacillus senegalensis TaxID=1936063 RepID=UPI000A30CBCE|nr:class I SAM-dependent methyltransferase [Oceanobacillus senegalensis]
MNDLYLDALAKLGVGGAHPGGLMLTKKLLTNEEMNEKTVFLDGGCGTGQTAAYVSHYFGSSVTAIDINQTMVDKAKTRFDAWNVPVHLLKGSIEDLPFEKNTFDVITSESVIAFSNAAKSVSEFRRVLKNHGVLLAIEMVLEKSMNDNDVRALRNFYGINRFWTSKEWVQMFQDAGFAQIQVTKYEQQFDPNDVDNAADFTLSDQLNDQLFDAIIQHEHYMEKYKDILGFRIFRCSKV